MKGKKGKEEIEIEAAAAGEGSGELRRGRDPRRLLARSPAHGQERRQLRRSARCSADKIIAAVCHGPQLLDRGRRRRGQEADVVAERAHRPAQRRREVGRQRGRRRRQADHVAQARRPPGVHRGDPRAARPAPDAKGWIVSLRGLRVRRALTELYQARSPQFIAERKRLAGELQGSGRRAQAQACSRTRAKPPVSAWVVNQLWWHARDAFDDLLKSAEKLRKGELAASAEHREAIAKLRKRAAAILEDAGHNANEATLRRVTTTLSAIAATGGFEPDAAGHARRSIAIHRASKRSAFRSEPIAATRAEEAEQPQDTRPRTSSRSAREAARARAGREARGRGREEAQSGREASPRSRAAHGEGRAARSRARREAAEKQLRAATEKAERAQEQSTSSEQARRARDADASGPCRSGSG